MDYLWAPWRVTYIEQPKAEGCILCEKPKADRDEDNLILFRGAHNFVILNLYPYNPGHLMVAPYRHIASPTLLTDAESAEHFRLVARCTEWLTEVMKPHGFNVGMNLGRVAGAGIDDHIHSHVVPRWDGDCNFMPVLADTKVVSESIEATYKKLKRNLASKR